MTDIELGGSFLIDSNVLIDAIVGDAVWGEWSATTLAQCLRAGVCQINPIIYSEVSHGYDDISELDDVLSSSVLHRESIPYGAAFLAARAHSAYRRRGGSKLATLPDFFIGAHAAVDGLTLVTRDPRRYRLAFPGVKLVTPQVTSGG